MDGSSPDLIFLFGLGLVASGGRVWWVGCWWWWVAINSWLMPALLGALWFLNPQSLVFISLYSILAWDWDFKSGDPHFGTSLRVLAVASWRTTRVSVSPSVRPPVRPSSPAFASSWSHNSSSSSSWAPHLDSEFWIWDLGLWSLAQKVNPTETGTRIYCSSESQLLISPQPFYKVTPLSILFLNFATKLWN